MSQEELEKLNLSNDMVSNVLRNNNGELRDMVLKYLLFKSGKEDCLKLFTETIINDLLDIAEKFNNEIGQLALDSIINITASEVGSKSIKSEQANRLMTLALRKDGLLADHACKVLANVTRYEEKTSEIVRELLDNFGLGDLITAVCDKSYNEKGLRLEYLAQVVGNLTQCGDFRACLLDPISGQFHRLLPILVQGATKLERLGVASALYNCLLDPGNHLTLLSEPYELLPVLLYPLAGPEEFKEDENEKLPMELQYLGDDKTRESDSHIRLLLLKCLLLLCRTRQPRVFVRDNGAYYILREYHKWEKDSRLILATENVVDLLIRTEDEIGLDDLASVDVPADMKEKFEKWDNDFIGSSE
ncbi:hypothetical protein O3M35_012473 [Rhynocoris fuscipes]|uniref:Protein HGH1 homolog n=1 Tax=Rhynocoris fuscipes TaxID=488301 RepID=A0AAW1D0F1_9HEMI